MLNQGLLRNIRVTRALATIHQILLLNISLDSGSSFTVTEETGNKINKFFIKRSHTHTFAYNKNSVSEGETRKFNPHFSKIF